MKTTEISLQEGEDLIKVAIGGQWFMSLYSDPVLDEFREVLQFPSLGRTGSAKAPRCIHLEIENLVLANEALVYV